MTLSDWVSKRIYLLCSNLLMKTDTDRHTNQISYFAQKSCPACHHSRMMVFFEIESAPVFCNVLWNSNDKALTAPRSPIHLAYCGDCGLIYNVVFEPQLMQYSSAYENSLHFSPCFQKYAENIANKLVQCYRLYNKKIIEIGCGKGDFLAMLQQLGNNQAVGFDPGYTPVKATASSKNSAVTILPETYSDSHNSRQADFICCRHVLEHIDHPLDFLTGIRKAIDSQNNCIVYFEVPNSLYIFEQMGVWDIIYEHCSYFNSQSLANLFVRAGFEPIEVAEQYNSQFLTIEAQPTKSSTNSTSTCKSSLQKIKNLVRIFHDAYKEKLHSWQNKLSELDKRKSRIVVWGAGSKGVTFLNALDISYERIEYVVDLNPSKHGKFIPCTGQQVIAPDFLKGYKPQTIIIMNPIYHTEIKQTIKDLDINAEVLTA